MRKFDAVVFDMDGVLIDARDWHMEALLEALALVDCPLTRDEHRDRFDGLPTKVKLEVLVGEGRLAAPLVSVVEGIKQERTLRIAAARCFPKLEHLLLLGELRSQGIAMGVATNSIRRTTESMLGFAGVLPYMSAVVTNEDVASPKPSPDVYLEVTKRLGCEPSRSLVIEDTQTGVDSAQSAGCYVVRVEGVEDVDRYLVEDLI